MKRLFIAIMLCVLVGISFAAITEYYNAPVASVGTYTAITGTGAGVSGDEDLSPALSIGFTFNYCGTDYTQAKMSTNGYLGMGTAHTFFYSYENYLNETTSTFYPFIAPLWDDLLCDDMSYTTTGAAPNRVFTAQWQNAAWDYGGTPGQNFQVKLYETLDKIEFVYGSFITPDSNSGGASIGINMAPGGAGNFWSITPGSPISSSSTVEYNSFANISLIPSGTTYAFNKAVIVTPPNPAVAVFPANGNTNIPSATNLYWSSGGGLPTGFRLNLGTNGGGVTTPNSVVNNANLGDVTSYNPAADLAISTVYYWQIVPYNANGLATGCPIWSFTTGGAPLRGEKTIDPAGSGPDNYTTFTAAITELNGAGVGTDGVIFYVPAGVNFDEAAMLPAITTTGTLANPIVFQKTGDGTNPLVTVNGTAGTHDYIFKLVDANYITFDGIDAANATAVSSIEYGYYLTGTPGGSGSSSNIIRNCTVTLDRSNLDSKGVYTLAVASPNNGNLFQNITVNSSYQGIWLGGMEYNEDANNTIQGCTLNTIAENNLYVDYQSWLTVFDNVINYPTSEPCASNVYGFNSYLITNVQLYNNTFSGGNLTRSMTNIMLNGPSEIEVHHNTISGTVSTGTWYVGIYVNMPGWGAVNIHHNEIHDITAGLVNWSIYTMRGYTINVNDNNIYNISTGMCYWGIHSIENLSLDTPTNIFNNNIHGITLTGDIIQMVSAINVQDRFANVFNNFVYDIKAPFTTYVDWGAAPQVCGISLGDLQAGQSERANVYNNTVLLTAYGTDNSSSSCFWSSFSGPVDLKNNVFINHSVPGINGKAAAFWQSTGSFDNYVGFDNYIASMDKNIYYAGTPDARHLIYTDPTHNVQTLAAYQTLNTGKDQSSYTEDVPFISAVAPFNLHINPATPTHVEGNGIYLPTVVIDDIDGNIRSTTPDLGADEGTFTTWVDAMAAPLGVAIVRSGANVQMSWNAVAGATGYKVYGSNSPFTALPWASLLVTVPAPTVSTLLTPTAAYKFYYVTAY